MFFQSRYELILVENITLDRCLFMAHISSGPVLGLRFPWWWFIPWENIVIKIIWGFAIRPSWALTLGWGIVRVGVCRRVHVWIGWWRVHKVLGHNGWLLVGILFLDLLVKTLELWFDGTHLALLFYHSFDLLYLILEMFARVLLNWDRDRDNFICRQRCIHPSLPLGLIHLCERSLLSL